MKVEYSTKFAFYFVLVSLGLIVIVKGCNFLKAIYGVGTHGKMKGYQYSVTKYILAEAVNSVLKNNKTIQRDTNYYYYQLYDSTGNIYGHSSDSAPGAVRAVQEHNDGIHNLSVYINSNNRVYSYEMGYVGDSAYWNNTKYSEIAIVYAWDDKGNGGSDGGDDFYGIKEIRKELIAVFEKEFINKLDKQLGQTHTEPD